MWEYPRFLFRFFMSYYCFNPRCKDREIRNPKGKTCPNCGTSLILKAESQEKLPSNPARKVWVRHLFKGVRPLGSGGMGETVVVVEVDEYGNEKRREEGRSLYALKRLVPHFFTDRATYEIAKQLFRDEAEALWELGSHPQIADYEQYVPDDVDGPFIVQEYIAAGTTLHELLDKDQEHFNEAKTLQLLVDMVPVLETIHRAGTIHRDVKPTNIVYPDPRHLLRSDRTTKPYLVDFGITLRSRSLNSAHAKAARTSGTPAYMAPEHMKGEATPRSDLFSLGLCALFALSGQEAIDDFDRKATQQQEDRYGERLAREFPMVGPVIAKMIRLREEDRYRTAREVLVALEALKTSSASRPASHPVTTALHTVVAAPSFERHQPKVTRSLTSMTLPAALAPKRLPYKKIVLVMVLLGTVGTASADILGNVDLVKLLPALQPRASEVTEDEETKEVPLPKSSDTPKQRSQEPAPKAQTTPPVVSDVPWREVEVVSGLTVRMPASVGSNQGSRDQAMFVAEENGLRYVVSSYRMSRPLVSHTRSSAAKELRAVAKHILGDNPIKFGKVHATREGFPTLLVEGTTKSGRPVFARITMGNLRGFTQTFTLVKRNKSEIGDEDEAFLNSATISAHLSKDLGFARAR